MTGEIMKISSISEDNYLIFLNKESFLFHDKVFEAPLK